MTDIETQIELEADDLREELSDEAIDREDAYSSFRSCAGWVCA